MMDNWRIVSTDSDLLNSSPAFTCNYDDKNIILIFIIRCVVPDAQLVYFQQNFKHCFPFATVVLFH